MSEYVHVSRGTEINLMSTLVKVTAEGCLVYGNRKLLYIDGLTTVGSACCGIRSRGGNKQPDSKSNQ